MTFRLLLVLASVAVMAGASCAQGSTTSDQGGSDRVSASTSRTTEPVVSDSPSTTATAVVEPAAADLFACQAALRVQRALSTDLGMVNREVSRLDDASKDIVNVNLRNAVARFLRAFKEGDAAATSARFAEIVEVCGALK